MTLAKPEPKAIVAHRYIECRDYLEDKYNFKERDFKAEPKRDFWAWVVNHYDVHRGCYITFSRQSIDGDYAVEPEWVRIIYNYYLDEFADDKGRLLLWVDW